MYMYCNFNCLQYRDSYCCVISSAILTGNKAKNIRGPNLKRTEPGKDRNLLGPNWKRAKTSGNLSHYFTLR